MFQKVAIAILINLYLIVLLQPLYPIILYHADHNYIVTHLCINRDKPWMHCNGKCFLKKELNDVFNKQHHHPEHLSLLNFKFSDFTDQLDRFLLPGPLAAAYNHVAGYYNNYHFSFLTNIFRPPQLLS